MLLMPLTSGARFGYCCRLRSVLTIKYCNNCPQIHQRDNTLVILSLRNLPAFRLSFRFCSVVTIPYRDVWKLLDFSTPVRAVGSCFCSRIFCFVSCFSDTRFGLSLSPLAVPSVSLSRDFFYLRLSALSSVYPLMPLTSWVSLSVYLPLPRLTGYPQFPLIL